MTAVTFGLRFPVVEIPKWAAAYSDSEQDAEVIEIGKHAAAAGHLKKPQFLAIAKWKSPRPAKHHRSNDESMVEEVTRFAFSTRLEPLRLKSLTLLVGVNARTASAILHLCHRDPYPLMDVRALWSLGVDEAPTDDRGWLALWPTYTGTCREIARSAKTDQRTLDQALWAFSRHHGKVAVAKR